MKLFCLVFSWKKLSCNLVSFNSDDSYEPRPKHCLVFYFVCAGNLFSIQINFQKQSHSAISVVWLRELHWRPSPEFPCKVVSLYYAVSARSGCSCSCLQFPFLPPPPPLRGPRVLQSNLRSNSVNFCHKKCHSNVNKPGL